MSSCTQSSWTPATTAFSRRTAARIDRDVCTTCNKKLPKLDDNLLKHSLRMQSEVAQANTQKSLMQMLARNDDFVYPITPQDNRPCPTPGEAATSKLIDIHRQQSVMNKYAQIKRNRGLHECEKLHTNSRKHEYRKWDFSHKHLADYHLKPASDHQMELWFEDDEELDDDDDDDSMHGTQKEFEGKSLAGVHFDASRNTRTAGRSTRRELESKDGEEDIPEPERVQMAINKIRTESSGGVLSEIHQIKERHRQLEALTLTKQRAMADAVKPKKFHKKIDDSQLEKDALRKFLLANANLEKDLEFNTFKERTTVKLNRNFKGSPAKAQDAGIVWMPKWSPTQSHIPGKISKSTHPVCDAKKKQTQVSFVPAKPGDLPPCVYLPKHIEAKTPMESAILLERFKKQTCKIDKLVA